MLLLSLGFPSCIAYISYYFPSAIGLSLYRTAMAAGQPQTWIDDDSLEVITRKETRLERVRNHFPYWILPLISATVWFGWYSDEYL